MSIHRSFDGGMVLQTIAAWLFATSLTVTALAQPNQPSDTCDGCSRTMGGGTGIMWFGVIGAWLVGMVVIAALVALTAFLIRRSRLR
jgi:hypothetical protein